MLLNTCIGDTHQIIWQKYTFGFFYRHLGLVVQIDLINEMNNTKIPEPH